MEPELESLLKTNAGCEQFLLEARFENGKHACTCGSDKGYKLANRRTIECACCGKQTSITEGTFFYRKKVSLVKCFAVLIQVLLGKVSELGQLAKELKMVPSTIWRWHQQLRILEDRMSSDGETVIVDRALLVKVLFRRSVETPAKEIQPANGLSDAQFKVSEVELSDRQFEPRSEEESRAVRTVSHHLAAAYRGVSEKYSQLYAAEFQFQQQTKRLSLMELLKLVVRAGPVSSLDVEAYSSPRFIRLPLARAPA
jgi:hypothetical protein